jgi:hypothetical protein
MEQRTKRCFALGACKVFLVAMTVLGGGCATMEPKKPALVSTNQGTVVFFEKYEFKSPPQDWSLMRDVEGGDFEFGFVKMEKGDFPTQTTFMYDDKPYGAARDLGKRAKYYQRFFLANAGVHLRLTKQEKLTIHAQEALALYLDSENPIRNEKSHSKIYLVKKGNRIISFVCTQWRPMKGAFSQEPFDHFETFVQSFKFLKPTFYEELEKEIEKLKE